MKSKDENIILIYKKIKKNESLKFHWNGYSNHNDGLSLLLLMEEKPLYYKSQLKLLLYSSLSNENIYIQKIKKSSLYFNLLMYSHGLMSNLHINQNHGLMESDYWYLKIK